MLFHLDLSFHHGGGKQKTRWTPGLSNSLMLKDTKLLRPFRQCYSVWSMYQQHEHHLELDRNADA